MNKNIIIVYFSGTGGVKKIAKTFYDISQKKGLIPELYPLEHANIYETGTIQENIKQASYLILLYPVHAFDAPEPVYTWLNHVEGYNIKTTVISVSGGGEVWPNIGTRATCCRTMTGKGFDIVNDKMMVMPSNWVVNTNEQAAIHLLKAIPVKVNTILEALLSGVVKRTPVKRQPLFQKIIAQLEKIGTHSFAKNLKITNTCTGCGWCARNCPIDNVVMEGKKPRFNKKCIMCFRCVYGCPSDSLKSNSFMVLKTGFSMKELEKKAEDLEPLPIEECTKGALWAGVRKYLLEESETES